MTILTPTTASGCTTPSTRLPEALFDRWQAGDSMAALAADHGIPEEQVEWGIELQAFRQAVAAFPPVARGSTLAAIVRLLRGFRHYRITNGKGRVVLTTVPEVG